MSPDGTQLAFVAQPHGGGAPRLYVRRLDQLTATPLAGTEDAVGPFFSPDGQWLGFFGGGKLKKIAVTGGAPVTLADAPTARGGSWAEDGTIVFAPTSRDSGLWRVPAAGGTAERLTTPAPGEATHRWPQVLPGGRAVLYTVSAVHRRTSRTPGSPCSRCPPARRRSCSAVAPTAAISQRPGSPTRRARRGHLTWVHDGTLFAAPFDLATLAVTGPAVPVVPGVMSSTTSGSAQVEVSHTGTLVYLPGGENASAAPLDWLTRDGKTTPLRATPANWSGVQIAPDGRRLAFSLTDAANMDVWTYDAARDALTRLTSDPGVNRNPVWTPDGQRLVYASSRGGGARVNLYWQRADGSGDATRLTTSPNTQFPGSWHPSGRVLAFQETRPQTSSDLLILPVEGDEASGWKPGTPTVFLEWAVHGAAAALLAGRAVAGLRIERVGRASRSTSGRFRDRAASGRSPRAAAPTPSGRARGMNCSTWRPTGGSWWCRTRPPATRFRPRSRASGARRRSRSGRSPGPASICTRTASAWRWRRRTEATAGPTHVTLMVQLLRRAAAARAGDEAMSLRELRGEEGQAHDP